jgi:hypothetical protein
MASNISAGQLKSSLFVWSSVDRWSWIVPLAAEKICMKQHEHSQQRLSFVYTWCLILFVSLGGATSWMWLYLEVQEWYPCANSSTLWFSLILTHFPFFISTCHIGTYHFCNIIFVVLCHCVLYICVIHCQQPVLSLWFHHQYFSLSKAPRLKLNWVNKLCFLCAVISWNYPLLVWWQWNKRERLSALLQLNVVRCTLLPKDCS